MCGGSNESLFHALIVCDHALLFWDTASGFIELKLPTLHHVTSARDLLDHNFVSKKDATVAASVLWVILNNRNKYTNREIGYQPHRQELVRALDIPTAEVLHAKPQPKWEPPGAGWIKVNTDGAIGCAQKCAGTGAIARDPSGTFVAAQATKVRSYNRPIHH